MQTSESGQTVARILINAVDALRPVSTGIGHAFVDVDLTIRPGSSGSATALVSVDQVLTCTTVLARRGRALV